MQIYSAYYDTEEKKYAGVYPRKFPVYVCENDNVKVGRFGARLWISCY